MIFHGMDGYIRIHTDSNDTRICSSSSCPTSPTKKCLKTGSHTKILCHGQNIDNLEFMSSFIHLLSYYEKISPDSKKILYEYKIFIAHSTF